MQTFKTITKEEQVVDVTTCNNCGNVCDRYEQTSIKASGGYDSKHLTDCSTYTFDLCEECLVKIMDGLKIPPVVCDMDGNVDYAIDREHHRNRKIKHDNREELFSADIARGVCPWTIHGEDGEDKVCERKSVGSIDGIPTCDICLRDDDHSPGIMVRGGVPTTLEQRKEIGLRYLEQVRNNLHPMPVGPHDLPIYISTAISMLVTDTIIAANELSRLCDGVDFNELSTCYLGNEKWISDRIPLSFSTDDEGILKAKIVNSWLIWAQKAGYRNAAACIKLGDSPEQYWNYYSVIKLL